ncbi:hypothetical protein [Methylomagnum sp.]
MTNLEATRSIRKTGDELFHINGTELPINLLSFWQWSSSGLLGNALRGTLAEFIVASDLGCTKGVRQQWDAYDMKTHDGIKIEVKSGAFLQSWKQKKLSPIVFGVQPTFGWDAEENTVSIAKIRQSNIYVFCVLEHKDKSSVDPLDMSQWKFYVLPTRTLNEKIGSQKTIALPSLLKLNPIEARYGEIRKVVVQALASSDG